MIDTLDRLYTSIIDRNRVLSRLRIYTVMRVFIRVFANLFLPIYFKLTQGNSAYCISPTQKEKGRIIVTLTSFPARISRLWLVIETILRQTYKPDMLILWLSEKQFPTTDSIPASLLNLRKRGLKIEVMPDDVRSHKKYCYALNRYPEDILITVDDDVFYDTHLIERMMKEHERHPDAVITNHAHRMTYNDEKHLNPYISWDRNTTSDEDLFVVGIGGNLYPPHSLHPLAADTELAYRLTPTGDDIWLNAMARLQNTPFIHTPYHFICQIPVINIHNVDLFTSNVPSENNIQITNLITYLKEQFGVNPFEDFKQNKETKTI